MKTALGGAGAGGGVGTGSYLSANVAPSNGGGSGGPAEPAKAATWRKNFSWFVASAKSLSTTTNVTMMMSSSSATSVFGLNATGGAHRVEKSKKSAKKTAKFTSPNSRPPMYLAISKLIDWICGRFDPPCPRAGSPQASATTSPHARLIFRMSHLNVIPAHHYTYRGQPRLQP